MPTFKIARFEVRPEFRLEVERAIREFALYVGLELEDSSWVTYRERANPNRYISLIAAQDEAAESRQRNDQGTADFTRILHPRLVGEVDLSEYVLVASSRGGVPPGSARRARIGTANVRWTLTSGVTCRRRASLGVERTWSPWPLGGGQPSVSSPTAFGTAAGRAGW